MTDKDTLPLVLFVDDLPEMRGLYAVGFEKFAAPFRAIFAEDVESAMRTLRECSPAAVVLDVNLSGETGFTIAEHMRDFCPDTPKAVLTAYDQMAIREQAEGLGMPVWPKPLTMDELVERVVGLLATRRPAGQVGLSQAGNFLRVLAAAVGLLGGAHVHKVH